MSSSYLGLKIPEFVSDYLLSLNLLGKIKDKSKHHITVLHFPKHNVDVENFLALLMSSIKDIKMNCSLQSLELFSGSDVLVSLVESSKLHSIRRNLVNFIDLLDLKYSNDYEYNPHITLSDLEFNTDNIENTRKFVLNKLEFELSSKDFFFKVKEG